MAATLARRINMVTPIDRAPQPAMAAVVRRALTVFAVPARPPGVAAVAARPRSVLVPTRTWGGGITTAPMDVDAPSQPVLLLIEVYGISRLDARDLRTQCLRPASV